MVTPAWEKLVLSISDLTVSETVPLPSSIHTQTVSVPFEGPRVLSKNHVAPLCLVTNYRTITNSRSGFETADLKGRVVLVRGHVIPSLMVIFTSDFHMCGPHFHHSGRILERNESAVLSS